MNDELLEDVDDVDDVGTRLNGVVVAGENDNTHVGDDNDNANVKRIVYNDDDDDNDDENFMIIVLYFFYDLVLIEFNECSKYQLNETKQVTGK